MTKNQAFSSKLVEIRSKLGLSQEVLASKLNVSFATVNRWENGKASPQKTAIEMIDRLYSEAMGENLVASDSAPSRVKRGVNKSNILSTKSMEQLLWDAACKIRGEKDAPKFKDYILPLLFVKRLSDVFDDEVLRLIERFGDKETALTVLEADHSLVRFYLPPNARWAVVSGREEFKWPEDKKPKTLGEQLTATIRSIVKSNPSLSGVIDIVDYNETRNGEREISDSALKGLVETFSDPRYRLGLQDVEPDFLGRAYEYLLRKFAEGQGQSAGEFFTPREVGFIMADILKPEPGMEAYDYACGSFGLLIKLQLTLRKNYSDSKIPLKLFGQELTGSSYAIACMNKIIHDMEGEVVRGNSMENPKFKGNDGKLKKFDIIIANPMWNQPFEQSVYENDSFNRFEEHGGTSAGKGDWAWLQHTVTSLKDNGRAAVVLDTGAVTRGSGSKNDDKEKKVRKWFIEKDLIEGVILLPDNLFYNTSAPGIIIFLNKNKHKNKEKKVFLINASAEFEKGSPKNHISADSAKKISEAFNKGTEIEGFSKFVTIDQIADKDYNLSPSRYLESARSTEIVDVELLFENLKNLDSELIEANIELNKILSLMSFK